MASSLATTVLPTTNPTSNRTETEQQNLNALQEYVTMCQHPHPTYVLLSIFISMFVIYLMWFILFINTPDGMWMDTSTKTKYKINYCKYFKDITISNLDTKDKHMGKMKNNLMDLNNKIGVWSDKYVYLINSDGTSLKLIKM